MTRRPSGLVMIGKQYPRHRRANGVATCVESTCRALADPFGRQSSRGAPRIIRKLALHKSEGFVQTLRSSKWKPPCRRSHLQCSRSDQQPEVARAQGNPVQRIARIPTTGSEGLPAWWGLVSLRTDRNPAAPVGVMNVGPRRGAPSRDVVPQGDPDRAAITSGYVSHLRSRGTRPAPPATRTT